MAQQQHSLFSTGTQVLIVDDDEKQCCLLQLVLARFKDIRVVGIAMDGTEAVELCPQLQPQVVLMDYMMPVMDGLVATRKIRQRHPGIQVIIYTAYHSESLASEATDAGAFSCVSKMIRLTELREYILSASMNQPDLPGKAD